MSGAEIDPPDPAAEYVLGTLDAAEADAAQARMAADPGFAAAVRAWEERLTPLTLLAAPVPPPEALWDRVQASCALNVPAPANENRPGWWRGTAIASLAVAAGLAAFIVLHPAPAPVFAVLTPIGSTAPVLVAFGGPHGGIVVRPGGAIHIATDRDLELWSLAAGALRPEPLGVIPPSGREILPIAAGTRLLVSLEPKGGSPTGQPTGPVMFGGTLQRANE